MMTSRPSHPDPDQNKTKSEKRTSARKIRLSRQGRIALAALAGGALVLGTVLFARCQPQEPAQKLSLTVLDSLKLADLYEKPQASFADRTEVKDYTIYGTSLVFYDTKYQPMDIDGYFGRNAKLKNIATGEEITLTFNGGADAGIDLQSLPVGVYEVYLTSGYTFSRAYMDEVFHSEPFVTMRDDKKVRSIRIDADREYLDQFGVEGDENYLFLTVTETLPVVRISDVVIDPSGYVSDVNGYQQPWYTDEKFDENEQSLLLARRIAAYLESAGLKVTFSRADEEYKGYGGSDSRVSAGYDSQSKVFLSLAMDDGMETRPFLVTSPFTNGQLGNDIVDCLTENGISMAAPVKTSQLSEGNLYDQFSVDAKGQYEPYTLQPAIRETGGKVTSAGKNENWKENAKYSSSFGMNGVLFYYASTQNEESREYYLGHVDTIARSIAQGILDYGGYDVTLTADSIQESDLNKDRTPVAQPDDSSTSEAPDSLSSSDQNSSSSQASSDSSYVEPIYEEPVEPVD